MIKTSSQTTSVNDQYTDRSGAALVKIASRLQNNAVAEEALNLLFSTERKDFRKVASFPTDSKENTILSRIYFDGQRDCFSKEAAEAIDNRISIYETLYHVKPDTSVKPIEKQASATYELLPGVEIVGESEFVKAAEEFSENYQQLSYADRCTFAKNFCKVAEDLAPVDVCLYAGVNTELRPDFKEQLHLRKLAADRCGKDGGEYEKLAVLLENADNSTFDSDSLHKLACTVNAIDESLGFTDVSYDKRLPDAWHALLRKHAEEEGSTESNTEKLSKSDIMARFGDQSLDEVENPDGTINQERLQQIMRLFGADPRDVDKTGDGSTSPNAVPEDATGKV